MINLIKYLWIKSEKKEIEEKQNRLKSEKKIKRPNEKEEMKKQNDDDVGKKLIETETIESGNV